MAEELQFETREEAEKFILARLTEADGLFDDQRLRAALALKTVRERFFNRNVDWSRWARGFIPKSSEARNKLLTIARAPDPAAKLKQLREYDRLRRERQKLGLVRQKPEPDLTDIDWWAVAVEAVQRFDPKQKIEFRDWYLRYIGQ